MDNNIILLPWVVGIMTGTLLTVAIVVFPLLHKISILSREVMERRKREAMFAELAERTRRP